MLSVSGTVLLILRAAQSFMIIHTSKCYTTISVQYQVQIFLNMSENKTVCLNDNKKTLNIYYPLKDSIKPTYKDVLLSCNQDSFRLIC